MAHSSRTWRGARSPQGKKRVRQSERRHAILGPRRAAAKTYIKTAVALSASGDPEQVQAAVIAAVSALDKAAKVGAIHPNAANRRKSRLMLKVNAAQSGTSVVAATKTRQTGKLAAAKAAKARIAAGKATKAKGEQTAAGKARAALSKSTREAQAASKATSASTATAPAATKATKTTTTKAAAGKSTTPKAATPKATTTKAATPKSTTTTTKAATPKSTTTKATTTTTKAPAKAKTTK